MARADADSPREGSLSLPETIYVDFDGTVVDVSRRYYLAHCLLCDRLGLAPLPFTEYWRHRRERHLLAQVLGTASPDLAAEYAVGWRELIESPAILAFDRLVPGVGEALRALAGRCRLVLATLRRSRESLESELAALGLAEPFEAVLCGQGPGEPWEAKRDLLAADLSRRAGSALVVGDTEADLLTARLLGLPAVAVLTGLRLSPYLSSLQPHAIIPSLAALPGLLGIERLAERSNLTHSPRFARRSPSPFAERGPGGEVRQRHRRTL